jgi:ribosomal protein S18 acetylase RimI-like enzyme
MLEIKQALSEDLYQATSVIFIEYANSLGINLDFQNFDDELKTIPSNYGPPEGCVLLAFHKNNLAGCVGVRKFKDGICEMKRLYVRPEFRRKKIGITLSKSIIEASCKIGYKYMRLDTLPQMKEAIALYQSLGFKEIKPYRYNPFEGAKFFELSLF